ncbi:MAG: DUF1700 domain-containing protein [Culicoidibacterales bacterium]
MNKAEYLRRLDDYLRSYDGNTQEILDNYRTIIEELLGEGLSMKEIVERLGSPSSLCDEIVAEFNLTYNKKTAMPLWAKVILIVIALIFALPLMSLVISLIFTVISVCVGAIFLIGGLLFAAVGASLVVWFENDVSLLVKILMSIGSLSGFIALSIIVYFVINGGIDVIKFILRKIKALWTNLSNKMK